MAESQAVQEQFTVRVTDDQGAFRDQLVTLTITGSNDEPVISFTAGEDSGATEEDGTLTASGTLNVIDIDQNSTADWGIQGNATGTYGSLALNGNSGEWTYTLNNSTDGDSNSPVQNLAEGEQVSESFTIRVTDQHGDFADQQVTITITGNTDAPTITATTNVSGEVSDCLLYTSPSPRD